MNIQQQKPRSTMHVEQIDELYKPGRGKKTQEQSVNDYQEAQAQARMERSEEIAAHQDDIIISWQGPEYEHHPKDGQWYLIAALFLASVVAYAIFTNSPLTAIVFILIGFVGYMYLEREPQIRTFALTDDGIIVGNEIYPYEDIASFWIFYEPPHTRVISLHMQGRLTPYIHIPLHQRDPVEVREALLQFIPEVHQEPSAIDTLERLLRI